MLKRFRWMVLFLLVIMGLGFSLLRPGLRSLAISDSSDAILVDQLVSQSSSQSVDSSVDVEQNFERHFQDLGINGSILIYDTNGDRVYQHNPSRNATSFLPASTFKILNALIALETGVMQDDLQILTWDGIEREIEAWNRDHNLRTAFQNSAVWFYQVLARRIGHERMQNYVTQVNYGNGTIGDAEAIDHFWLDGDLSITPEEQIQFLRRIYENDLPFSDRTLALVKDIMIFEQTPDYTLRAKTGWARGSLDVGWFVGYLEQNENVYFFATNIDMPSLDNAPDRIEVTRRCLQDLSLL